MRTDPTILSLRVDESLFFANARYLEVHVYTRVAGDAWLRNVVLMLSAVNEIDSSALESLEAINERLRDRGLSLHFSEVKGPVMDPLERMDLTQRLTGNIYLSQYKAIMDLSNEFRKRRWEKASWFRLHAT